MVAKTPFTKAEIIDLLAHYDLGTYQDHTPFARGADQTNFLVVTTSGRYAFRYYEKRSLDYVLFEIDLLRYLANQSYPSPAPLQNQQGEYVGVYHQKPFALFTYLEGEHSDDTGNVGEVAKAIAQLHRITAGYRPTHAEARDQYDPASCLAYAHTTAQHIPSRAAAKVRLEWLAAGLGTLQLPDSMPQGTCHRDPNPTNFLYKAGRVNAVLDFDQAGYTYLLNDVASLIYWWTWPPQGEIDFPRSKALLRAYESGRSLTQQEKEHLYDMLKVINYMGYAWFIHDDEDYPHSQRNIERLNALGREEFYRRLFEP